MDIGNNTMIYNYAVKCLLNELIGFSSREDTRRESAIPRWTGDTVCSKFENQTIKRGYSYLRNDDPCISMSGRAIYFRVT